MSAPLGFGLALDDGDLTFDGDALALVSGRANLVQALTVRLRTPLGSDRFDTTYGLDVRASLTEPHGRQMARELLRMDLLRTLTADPRVGAVHDVIFADEATPGSRARGVTVVVATVDGDTTAVFLEPAPVRLP